MSAWTLFDPATSETWVMPINPDAMTSPHPRKDFKHASGVRNGLDRIRSMMTPPTPTEWSWEGVIRTEAHYNSLLAWAQKTDVVHVTDHLGRTWQIVMKKFTPTDRKPMANVPWRMRYQMTVINLGGVA